MALKIPTSSIARPSKIYPNWDFWFENIPSGNTGLRAFLSVNPLALFSLARLKVNRASQIREKAKSNGKKSFPLLRQMIITLHLLYE
jgi:hypothetical protein